MSSRPNTSSAVAADRFFARPSPPSDQSAIRGEETPEGDEHTDAVVATYLREDEEAEQPRDHWPRESRRKRSGSPAAEERRPTTGHEQATEKQQKPGGTDETEYAIAAFVVVPAFCEVELCKMTDRADAMLPNGSTNQTLRRRSPPRSDAAGRPAFAPCSR